MQVGLRRVYSETRDLTTASTRPTEKIAHTERNKVLWADVTVCVCACMCVWLCVRLCGSLCVYHHNLISTYLDNRFKTDHHRVFVRQHIDHRYVIKVDISKFRADHCQCLMLKCFSPIWVRTSKKTVSILHIVSFSSRRYDTQNTLLWKPIAAIQYIETYLNLYIKCLLRFSDFSQTENIYIFCGTPKYKFLLNPSSGNEDAEKRTGKTNRNYEFILFIIYTKKVCCINYHHTCLHV